MDPSALYIQREMSSLALEEMKPCRARLRMAVAIALRADIKHRRLWQMGRAETALRARRRHCRWQALYGASIEQSASPDRVDRAPGKRQHPQAWAERVADIVCNKLGIAAGCGTRDLPLASYRLFYQ